MHIIFEPTTHKILRSDMVMSRSRHSVRIHRDPQGRPPQCRRWVDGQRALEEDVGQNHRQGTPGATVKASVEALSILTLGGYLLPKTGSAEGLSAKFGVKTDPILFLVRIF